MIQIYLQLKYLGVSQPDPPTPVPVPVMPSAGSNQPPASSAAANLPHSTNYSDDARYGLELHFIYVRKYLTHFKRG